MEDQNGVITVYEYELDIYPVALGEEWPDKGFINDTVIIFLELPHDTLFQFRVRALTSAGPGPYSEFAFAKTPGLKSGSEKNLSKFQEIHIHTHAPPTHIHGHTHPYTTHVHPHTRKRNTEKEKQNKTKQQQQIIPYMAPTKLLFQALNPYDL